MHFFPCCFIVLKYIAKQGNSSIMHACATSTHSALRFDLVYCMATVLRLPEVPSSNQQILCAAINTHCHHINQSREDVFLKTCAVRSSNVF